MSVAPRTRQSSVLDIVSETFSPLFFWKNENDISDLVMDPFEAVRELNRRRQDPTLQRKVEEYLQGDIPDYFKDGPVLHVARHIVSPNFETLRFLHLISDLGLQPIISYDSKGLFVSQNQDKRALCKLPVSIRITQRNGRFNEQYQNVTIVDFSKADGKIFSEIKTFWGEDLIHFHARLFSEIGASTIETPDDAAWIDRHNRNDLLELHKQQFALFIANGIFVDNYNLNDPHEVRYLNEIVKPAYRFIKNHFGYAPLIIQMIPSCFESYHYWISYPPKVLDIVHESLKGK